VPLSPQAAALFREAVEATGDSKFVFPGQRSPSHIAPRSVSKAMERTRQNLGIQDITIHDLRRTAGTSMGRFGVPRDVRERILNHGGKRKGNVTDGVYNRYEYDAEKRAALELWADALDGIIEGGPWRSTATTSGYRGTKAQTRLDCAKLPKSPGMPARQRARQAARIHAA
jgi:hypothetical protein